MVLLIRHVITVQLPGDTVLFDQPGIKSARILDRALLGLIIHMDETEAGAFSFQPFKIIGEAPVIIALNG